MATGNAFAGFKEASISFPPTFKYDVLRSLKRSRTKSLRRPPATPIIMTPHEKVLSEVAEAEREQEAAADEDRRTQHEQHGDEDHEQEQDAVSVVSTAWTSVRSRRTVDRDQEDDDDDDEDENEDEKESEPSSARSFGQSPPTSASAANLAHKLWSAAAAHKAKEKWVSLFNAGDSPRSPSPISKLKHNVSTASKKNWRRSWHSNKSDAKSPPPRRASQPAGELLLLQTQTQVDPGDPRQSKAGRAREFQAALLDAVHARPHMHLALSVNNVDLEEEEKGVYDSSHKQRVPSWSVRFVG